MKRAKVWAPLGVGVVALLGIADALTSRQLRDNWGFQMTEHVIHHDETLKKTFGGPPELAYRVSSSRNGPFFCLYGKLHGINGKRGKFEACVKVVQKVGALYTLTVKTGEGDTLRIVTPDAPITERRLMNLR